MSGGITEDDIERLQAITAHGHNDPEAAVMDPIDVEPEPGGGAYQVTEGVCRAINRAREDSQSYGEIARDMGLNKMTVKRHADDYGPRSCEHESPGINAERCGAIREAARSGTSQRKLTERANVTRGTVQYHIKGKCECDTDVPPVEYDHIGSRKVTPAMCARIRAARRRGETQVALAEKLDINRRTVRVHEKGRCDHD